MSRFFKFIAVFFVFNISLTLFAKKDGLPEVILLGDSIRMNYQQRVKNDLKGIAKVWFPKENGRHTAYTLKKLDYWLKGHSPAVIHINCGLHDMWLEPQGKCRFSPKVYGENLKSILLRLREMTDATIILALTTPVNEQYQKTSKTYGRIVRREKDIPEYNKVAINVAKELNVRVNDLYSPLASSGKNVVICKDGVHLSKKGNDVAVKNVEESIVQTLNEK